MSEEARGGKVWKGGRTVSEMTLAKMVEIAGKLAADIPADDCLWFANDSWKKFQELVLVKREDRKQLQPYFDLCGMQCFVDEQVPSMTIESGTYKVENGIMVKKIRKIYKF